MNLRDMVSKETIARLESKVPPEEVDKLLLSIAETILAKGQEQESQSQNQQPANQKEKDPGAEPMPMQ